MNYFATEIDRAGTVAVDDTVLVKGYETKAGSHILDGFVPLFSSDAVERLLKAGFTLRGKTHTGEFGLDLIKVDPAVASGPLITTINDLVAVVT